MRLIVLLFLLLGVALFAFVLAQIDVGELVLQLQAFGWNGVLAVLAVSIVWFAFDVGAWVLVSRWAVIGWRWFARLFVIQLIGEALNNVTPLASFGGEPVKAMLLNRHYGIAYRDGVASLVLVQTTIVLGEILFLFIGFALIVADGTFSPSYRLAGGLVIVIFVALVVGLIAIQRMRMLSRTVSWLSHRWMGQRARRAILAIRTVESRLITFYRGHPLRLRGAVALEFLDWVLGALEIWVVLHFLGFPVSLSEAWVIEVAVVMVRNATFLIPSSTGAQEAAFLFVCGAVIGSPMAGVAVAVIRRFRELAWTLLGLIAGAAQAVSDRLPLSRDIERPRLPGVAPR